MMFVANNIDSARIRGAELTAATSIAGWELAGQASVTDPRNRSADNAGKLLPRRARQSTRIDADRAFAHWRLGATWLAEGGRYDDVANTLHVGGYATLDLRAGLALAGDWSLQAELRNVFDRRYETAAYYNQPGREWGLSVRWRPSR